MDVPIYIKNYIQCQLVFRNISTEIMDYICEMGKVMELNNYDDKYKYILRTDLNNRMVIAEDLMITDRAVQKTLSLLIREKILIPKVRDNGRAVRAVYYVDNWVIPEKEWKEIKKLTCEFDFVEQRAIVRKEHNIEK